MRRLYTEFHPEDADIMLEDIKMETLESVMVNTLYNDLGFMVRDKLMVLAETQSDWCPNMTLRMLFYLSETYRRYITDTEQSEHSPRKLKLPKPELYVVYTGRKAVPVVLSMNEEFFGGDSPIDIRIKVLREVDETICGEYVGFCHVYDEQRKIYHDSTECAKKTVEIAMERGYLTEFLYQHRAEVITMMEELFDEEYARKRYEAAERKYYREEYQKQLAEEVAKSRVESKAEGIAEGMVKNAMNNAANLLRMGLLSRENIALATGLSMEQINEIAATV